MTRSTIRLCLVNLVANALLLWLGYYWLGLGEPDGLNLAWSAFVVLAFGCGAVWLHGLNLAYFQDHESGLTRAAQSTLGNLIPLLATTAGALVVYGVISLWRSSFDHNAFLIGSYATMKLRKPVPPSAVMRAFFVLIWLMRWLVIPAFLFPLAASVATEGWRGFRLNSFKHRKRLIYWAAVCGLLVSAFWLPLKLVAWVPPLSRFPWQMVSFLLRLGLAYLVFVAALMSLEFLTSGGKPRANQVSTAALP